MGRRSAANGRRHGPGAGQPHPSAPGVRVGALSYLLDLGSASLDAAEFDELTTLARRAVAAGDAAAACELYERALGLWRGRALEDLRDHACRLGAGDTSRLDELHTLFLPTGPLQDIAIDSGWHDKYMPLASRFDELYRQWRSCRSGDDVAGPACAG